MSLRDELQSALSDLIKEEPETITSGGDTFPALITRPSLDSNFMPGAELQETTIQARIARADIPTDPDLQTTWTIRGKEYRLINFEPYPSSILLSFGDPFN